MIAGPSSAQRCSTRSVDNSINRCVPVCYSARTQPPAKSYVAAYEELKKRLAELEEK